MFLKPFVILTLLILTGSTVSSFSGVHENNEQSETLLQIKVVSLAGCQATPPTIERIKETAKELGLQIELEQVIIRTPEETEKQRHIGSPTVQFNGLDIDPDAREIAQFGIT